MEKLVVYKDKKLLFKDVSVHSEYTDTRGRTVQITNWFPYDFVAEQPFITCFKSFVTWWCANRYLDEDDDSCQTRSEFTHVLDKVTTYFDFSYMMPKEDLLSYHSGSLLDEPLRFSQSGHRDT